MFLGYIYQEWLPITIIISVLCILAGRTYSKNISSTLLDKSILVFGLMVVLIIISAVFDYAYLNNYEYDQKTLPKPLWGCPLLEEQIQLDNSLNKSTEASTWQSHIDEPECEPGTLATVIISNLLIFLSFFMFPICYRVAFESQIPESSQERRQTESREGDPPQSDTNVTLRDEVEPILDLCKWRYDDLCEDYQHLLNDICSNFLDTASQGNARSQCELLIDFIATQYSSDTEKEYKDGFRGQYSELPYALCKWKTFESNTKSQGLALKTSKSIFCWTAFFSQADLIDVLNKFVLFQQQEKYADVSFNYGKSTKTLEEIIKHQTYNA